MKSSFYLWRNEDGRHYVEEHRGHIEKRLNLGYFLLNDEWMVADLSTGHVYDFPPKKTLRSAMKNAMEYPYLEFINKVRSGNDYQTLCDEFTKLIRAERKNKLNLICGAGTTD